MSDSGYVLIDEKNNFFNGFGTNFDSQLRNARVYHSLKYALAAKQHIQSTTDKTIKLAKVAINVTEEVNEVE